MQGESDLLENLMTESPNGTLATESLDAGMVGHETIPIYSLRLADGSYRDIPFDPRADWDGTSERCHLQAFSWWLEREA